MLAEAKAASERFASEESIDVDWERIWSIEPILFDETLIGFAEEAIQAVAPTTHRLPSGPLHDAAEVSRAGVPTVMLFVQSLRGLSHTKLEDTREEHLELAVSALDGLASRTIAWVAGGGQAGPDSAPTAGVAAGLAVGGCLTWNVSNVGAAATRSPLTTASRWQSSGS